MNAQTITLEQILQIGIDVKENKPEWPEVPQPIKK